MLAHCNRWLLAAATLYLALMPTNALNFWRTLGFVGGSVCAVALLVAALRGRAAPIPSPGSALLWTAAAWGLWSLASIAWSVHPRYSWGQARSEIVYTALIVLMVYVAAANARAFRIMVVALLATFAVNAAFAVALELSPLGWDPGRWHLGVGPWTTLLVLLTPFFLLLVMPAPVGIGSARRAFAAAAVLMLLTLVTARIADNRMVWVAEGAALAVIALLAGLRWRGQHAAMRWIIPLALLLVVTSAALFTDTAREKAEAYFPPDTSIAETLSADPRIVLWEHMVSHIRDRPWQGYGFGRAILKAELRAELGDPLLWHAHNMFGSIWLQTGAVGLALFLAMLGAVGARYVAFYRSRDDVVATLGIVGLAMIVGFVVKNLTDDFLFHSNAKQFFALHALLLGWGMHRLRQGAAAPVPMQPSAAAAPAAGQG